MSRFAMEHFTKTSGDNILNLSKAEATFLEEMIGSSTWRRLLIDLSARHTDSALLTYCLKAISKGGHHREIAKRIDQSDYFGVFNSMLTSEVEQIGMISASTVASSASTGITDAADAPPSPLRGLFLLRLVMLSLPTMLALDKASPRKPKVRMERRSSNSTSLEVAKRVAANCRSGGDMPHPSSVTVSIRSPPPCNCTSIVVGPASRLFSMSSFTTDAGLCTTSPAAIRSTTSLGRG